jgi:hypothetical protein
MCGLCIFSYVGFIVKTEVINYLPSYTVYMCFMGGLCDKNHGMFDSGMVSQHVNSTLIYLLVMNMVCNVIFAMCIFKLRAIKSEFNFRFEMLLTFIAWFILTQLSIGFFIHQGPEYPTFDWVYLLLVIRSNLAVILTAGRPLYLS